MVVEIRHINHVVIIWKAQRGSVTQIKYYKYIIQWGGGKNISEVMYTC